MIKIVHIAKPVGGVGVYLDLLTKHLNKERFEHVLLYNKYEVKSSQIRYKKLYHIPIIREIKVLTDLKCLFKIIEYLKEEKPDKIHCHSAKAGILGRIASAYLKIPTYYTPHAYSYLSAESKFKRNIFKRIEKFFRFFPSKTIACSQSEYNRTINELKFNKNKVFLWNNSIEDNLAGKPSKILQELPQQFICSIGRPSYQKHTELLVKTIIEAKKSVKNIHLVILGVGFYSPSYKSVLKLIKSNGLVKNITLVPWIDREEAITILKNSLFYISTSRYEGLPYSVIEAIALNKPCIVTKVDGNQDLLKNTYNGFLVEEKAEIIASKVIDLINNKEMIEKMGDNSRKLFEENFIINNNIKKLEQIYFE